MHILVITHALSGPWTGNRTTAARWVSLLTELGHQVDLAESYDGQATDLMVALHARRSHPSILRYRQERPKAALVVALTGTDVYRDIDSDEDARASVDAATRLVVLQPMAIDRLPAHVRHRARTIYQSIGECLPQLQKSPTAREDEFFDVCVLAHLREVKDPFRPAEAVRLLPPSSRIRILHAGAALSEAMGQRAERESRENPRYRWLGELPPDEARALIANSRALILCSVLEGGANVVTEAIAARTPVICSRVAGSMGLLGAHYGGFFEVGDTEEAARLLGRLENDADYFATLTEHVAGLQPMVSREREREAWRRLLDEAMADQAVQETTVSGAVRGESRFQLQEGSAEMARDTFAQEVREGLAASPKRLACRYFYDAAGSQLFEEICALPEYYVTRAEREILAERAEDIIAPFDTAIDLVELGSGSASKTRMLVEALLRRHGCLRYVPIDISRAALERSANELLRDYAGLTVSGIVAEYGAGLRWLQRSHEASRLILWLGSNIGNLHRKDATQFVRQISETMRPVDRLLLGIDRRKPRAILEAAYDDRQGVTARFNFNVLTRVNRELGGRFDLERFAHRAVFNEAQGRVEMHLVSEQSQDVAIDALETSVGFRAGETVHTENSYKYSWPEIEQLASEAGCRILAHYQDLRSQFSSVLLARLE